jgi:DNA-binding MarR family transcriptional regulator
VTPITRRRATTLAAAAATRRVAKERPATNATVADPAAALAPPAFRAPAPAPTELDQSRLAHLVGYAASRAAITLRRLFTQRFAPLELKVVEFSVLVLVAANPEVKQRQLGETLEISAPNLTVMLDRMVERGWIERVRGTRDRREMHIHLTVAGGDLVRRAERIAATMEGPALPMLSAAERALLIELLMKVVAGARANPR